MLSDLAPLSFTLTCVVTLAVAMLMFIAQLTALGVFLPGPRRVRTSRGVCTQGSGVAFAKPNRP